MKPYVVKKTVSLISYEVSNHLLNNSKGYLHGKQMKAKFIESLLLTFTLTVLLLHNFSIY